MITNFADVKKALYKSIENKNSITGQNFKILDLPAENTQILCNVNIKNKGEITFIAFSNHDNIIVENATMNGSVLYKTANDIKTIAISLDASGTYEVTTHTEVIYGYVDKFEISSLASINGYSAFDFSSANFVTNKARVNNIVIPARDNADFVKVTNSDEKIAVKDYSLSYEINSGKTINIKNSSSNLLSLDNTGNASYLNGNISATTDGTKLTAIIPNLDLDLNELTSKIKTLIINGNSAESSAQLTYKTIGLTTTNLTNSGAFSNTGNVLFENKLDVNGVLTSKANVVLGSTASNTLVVNSTTTLNENTTIKKNLAVNGNLALNGNATIGDANTDSHTIKGSLELVGGSLKFSNSIEKGTNNQPLYINANGNFAKITITNNNVATTVTSNDEQLVTGKTVYHALPTINGVHDYKSSTNYYVATAKGSDGQLLTSDGTNSPKWKYLSTLKKSNGTDVLSVDDNGKVTATGALSAKSLSITNVLDVFEAGENTIINIYKSILPKTTKNINLGSNDLRFKDIYVETLHYGSLSSDLSGTILDIAAGGTGNNLAAEVRKKYSLIRVGDIDGNGKPSKLEVSNETLGANDKFIYEKEGVLTASNLTTAAEKPVRFNNGKVEALNSISGVNITASTTSFIQIGKIKITASGDDILISSIS